MRLNSGKSAGALLAAAAVAVGAAVAMSAGYTVAHATLADGSAFVAKGDAVAHVNGEAGTTDAATKPVAKPGDPLTVIRLPNGDAASIDPKTNTLTVINGGTMTPTATAQPKAGKAPMTVVVSGSVGWLVDPGAATVSPINDGRPGQPVRLSTAPIDAAQGPDGSVIVLGATGQVSQVDTDGSTHVIGTAPATASALTVAGNHTYVVTPTGSVMRVDTTPTTVASVPGFGPSPAGKMLVGALQGAGSHVLVISSDTLAIIDPSTGQPELIALHTEADTLGQPVEFGNDVYVPDYTAHAVIQVSEASRAPVGRLAVPGDAASFALFVSGGKLWANDQYAEHLLVVNSSGQKRSIDKGPGDGVHDPRPDRPGRTRQSPPTRSTPLTPDLPPAPPPVVDVPVSPRPAAGNPPAAAGNPPAGPGIPPVGRRGKRQQPAPTTPAAPALVPIPSFPAGTTYADACSQLVALSLQCSAVAAGTDHSGATDTVIGTVPVAGRKVAPGSLVVVSYVGPASVPSLPSGPVTPTQACQLIEAASLTCNPQPASSPGTIADFGTVSGTNPAAGQQAAKGTSVTVTYYDAFAMPDAVSTRPSGTTLCSQITALTLQLPNKPAEHPSCTAAVGTQPTNTPANAGLVYAQAPGPGTAVTASGAVSLTVWPGSYVLPDWASQRDAQGLYLDASQVQAACLQAFSGCTLVTGDPPAPPTSPAVHPADAGRFEKTSPAPGTYAVGTPVTIYVWSSQNTVPAVTGLPIDQACAAIAAAGFVCDSSQHPLNPTVGTALSQAPAPGTPAALGSSVVVPNANVSTTLYRQYINPNTLDDNVVVVEGTSSWGPGRVHFYAYAPGALGAAGITVEHWQCAKNVCAATRLDAYVDAGTSPGGGYVDKGAAFQLMPGFGGETCGAGQTGVWEQWQSTHLYVVTQAYLAVNGTKSFLGCAWMP